MHLQAAAAEGQRPDQVLGLHGTCCRQLLQHRRARGLGPGYHSRSSSSGSGSSLVVSAAAVPDIYKEGVDPEIAVFQNHQKTAARPTPAEDARTLMALAQYGVLSTVSSQAGSAGYPFGSVVEFAVDPEGRPLLATSTLSPHSADMEADGRCSITVTAPGFKGLADRRFTLVGTAQLLPASARAGARETFLAKYPNAFYVDFGDFRWFRIDNLQGGRWVGGFGGGTNVTAEAYLLAKPDPVASFAPHVAGHMNGEDSHIQDMKDMVKHYVGLTVSDVKMLEMDRLGVNMQCTKDKQGFKLRLPFIRPAEDRKSVKEVLVEMTKTARAAVRDDGSL
eukprot:GHUV01025200.1.p1 GENE.GHUV01025200.1~~GHUV01025200.1.p1  ORF type:complete len:335 (+),score=101.09 GHUV01025200.1:144-1148(+)